MNTRHHPNIRNVNYFRITLLYTKLYAVFSTQYCCPYLYESTCAYDNNVKTLVYCAYNTQMNRCNSRSRGCTLDATDRTADPLLDLNLVYLKMARWLYFQLVKTVAWYGNRYCHRYFHERYITVTLSVTFRERDSKSIVQILLQALHKE
jgi:hypothetical protein